MHRSICLCLPVRSFLFPFATSNWDSWESQRESAEGKGWSALPPEGARALPSTTSNRPPDAATVQVATTAAALHLDGTRALN